MDKKEQTSLLVEEEDEIEDSQLQLIRKSKLQITKNDINSTDSIDSLTPKDEALNNDHSIHEGQNGNSTNGIDFLSPKDEAPLNGHSVHQGQNGNSTTNESENGVNGSPPIVVEHFLEAENHGGHNNIVYYDKDEGGNFISAFSGEESTKEGASIDRSDIESQSGIVDKNLNSLIDDLPKEHVKDDSFSASSLQSSGVIDNIDTISKDTSTIKEIESVDADLIDESDSDVEEIDLEKVLPKIKTHDLYCPNCNSCITRRVILRKRKRRIRPLSEDIKRNKLEAEIKSEAGAGSLEQISNQGTVSPNPHNSSSIPPAETCDLDREPEIFRCLACFSFFIPTGNGFNLFGRTNEKSTSLKNQISQPSKNWFSSIFAPSKGRTPQEQGNMDKESRESNKKGLHTPLIIDNENKLSSITDRGVSSSRTTDGLQGSEATKPQESAPLGNMKNNVSYQSQDNGLNVELEVDNGKQTLSYQKYDESVSIDSSVTLGNGEDAAASVLETHLDGLKFLISSDGRPGLLGRSSADSKYMKSNKSPDDDDLRNNFVTDDKEYVAVDIPREYEQRTETLHDAGTIDVKDTHGDSISTNTNQMSIRTDIHIRSEDNLKAKWEVVSQASSYKETIVTVGAGTEVAPQITEEAIASTQQVASQVGGHVGVVEQRASGGGESYGIEIIKSIVYGGLVESITSLSVVSSAAGGGAATLHILALGLANLIGGIFIICHNLYQLKNDQADDAINQVSEKNNNQADDTINQVSKKNDKYRELLGKRKNFVLHAFVAILSYLIFGLFPPVIFGFSFLKSDDRELKLAVVAAASLLCILVLAIAKAYVQRPPKTYVGTVLRYLILGFMVSGVSYVAGVLFEKLLNDLGLFENPISGPTLSFPVKPSINQAWSSF